MEGIVLTCVPMHLVYGSICILYQQFAPSQFWDQENDAVTLMCCFLCILDQWEGTQQLVRCSFPPGNTPLVTLWKRQISEFFLYDGIVTL